MTTAIEWTDESWNPVRGCSRVSAGCENCYAEKVARRFAGEGGPYEGLVRLTADGKPRDRWNGEIKLVPDHLEKPLRWRKPRRVFVNSMSDLFHEKVPDEYIAAVFGVMAAAPRHTFQILTKRPGRAIEWFKWMGTHAAPPRVIAQRMAGTRGQRVTMPARPGVIFRVDELHLLDTVWPPPNVWLGVSVEDQESAATRIPVLLDCPAAVRFISYEPALGPLHLLDSWLHGLFRHCPIEDAHLKDPDTYEGDPCEGCEGWGPECGAVRGSSLDWVIVGGESGPGARPFDLEWGRAVVDACELAGVACFVKQLGARPGHYRVIDANAQRGWFQGQDVDLSHLHIRDRKGGDIAEWPRNLRVRQFPEVAP